MPIYIGKSILQKTTAELKNIGIYPGRKVSIFLNYHNAIERFRELPTDHRYKEDCYILHIKDLGLADRILLSFKGNTKSTSPYKYTRFNYISDISFRESLIEAYDNPFTREMDLTNKRLHWFLENTNVIEVDGVKDSFCNRIKSIDDLVSNIELLDFPETQSIINSIKSIKK